ncbi:hypothetical protein [Vibrio parahaemolyticus]|uniref:hypothetical protein n=1 Tax=Vibrio parahaemolyticus TaxID=670 RepID=UPI00111F4E78|nr:hypothetical protein [Vibrio parahaemolyticus]TOB38347.1 hypothetical protein CGK06_23705 [Vibrio parahaemolyticus]
MKKTVLTTLVLSLGVASAAMAADMPQGGATLQWAGSVPPVTTPGAGYYIVKDGVVDFTSGLLTFTNDTSGIALKSASQIGFKVVTDATSGGAYDPSVDVAPLNYKYSLVDVKVGINGLATSQDPSTGYFAVHANGNATALVLNTEQAITTKGEPTRLTIMPNGAAPATLTEGADVVVMSVLTVTPDDTAI